MSMIVIVEDDARLRALMADQLLASGHRITSFDSAESLLESDTELDIDLLLLDVRLPGMSGVELVQELSDRSRLPTTVIVSGEATISETVAALQQGVWDFIEKPFSPERLERSVENALRHRRLSGELRKLRARLGPSSQILGESSAIEELRSLLTRAAPTNATVLILGESGTGKELVASALHDLSHRTDEPMVRVNCAAIPENLIEAELFGHTRGAFTDAREARAGLLEQADRGTLLLDEIGDMPAPLQARLLRVLEDGRVRRVGGNSEILVDARIIASTHHDLRREADTGEFRRDLFFRLSQVIIEIPPLRERNGDIAVLALHFLDRACVAHGRRMPLLSNSALDALQSYRWPGNVRELKHLMERLAIFGGAEVHAEQLPSSITGECRQTETGVLRLDTIGPGDPPTLRELRERCEREYIETVLHQSRWNVAEAARRLGLQRTYLHQKMSALGIDRPHPT